MGFCALAGEYVVLRLPLSRFQPTGRPLPSDYEIRGMEVRDLHRESERTLLRDSFGNWQAPFEGDLKGWRDDSPLYLVQGATLVGGVFVCDQNEFDDDPRWGQVHYAFLRPDHRGRGLYSPLFRRAVELAAAWGLEGLVLNSDREILPEVYLRWGAVFWKTIPKKPAPRPTGTRERTTVVHSFPTWLPLTQGWMHTLVSSLPDGFESHVVCERTGHLDSFPWPKIRASFAGRLPRRIPSRWHLAYHQGFLAVRLARLRAHVLHSHFGDVGWQDLRAAAFAHVPHVVSFYGHDAGSLPEVPPWRDRFRDLFGRARLILAEGPAMAQRLEALGCPRERLAVLHLGVPLDTLPFLPSVWDGAGTLRILIAASFRAKKGIPLALTAAARLRADLPVQVTLVGDAGSEPASQAETVRVLEAMREHDLGTDLRWLGTLSPRQLRAEARAHHVLLAPSLTAPSGDTEGGLPVTLLEMAALGVAVVTTRHADIPELVQHQVTGLLADEGNVDDLVEGVRWLVSHGAEWSRMLLAARARVEASFDARRQGDLLGNLYSSLVP